MGQSSLAQVRAPSRPTSPVSNPIARLTAQAHRSLFIATRAHLAGLEQPVLGDPGERLLKDLLAVGLKHDALAGTPGARVHTRMKALGELGLIMVCIELRPHIDVALGAPQR